MYPPLFIILFNIILDLLAENVCGKFVTDIYWLSIVFVLESVIMIHCVVFLWIFLVRY